MQINRERNKRRPGAFLLLIVCREIRTLHSPWSVVKSSSSEKILAGLRARPQRDEKWGAPWCIFGERICNALISKYYSYIYIYIYVCVGGWVGGWVGRER